MRAAVLVVGAVVAAGCGYTIGGAAPGGVRSIRVATLDADGVDVDAAGLVGAAVRRAIARGPSTRLSPGEGSEALLRVRLIGAASSLLPLADPAVRAAQYRAEVRIEGTLEGRDGAVLWRSGLVTGEAPYFSVPAEVGVETLEGHRRRALAQAAEDAAARLVLAMVYGS